MPSISTQVNSRLTATSWPHVIGFSPAFLMCKLDVRIGSRYVHRFGGRENERVVISGIVQSDEGRIRLIVQGPEGREQEIEGVIDTGYTASCRCRPRWWPHLFPFVFPQSRTRNLARGKEREKSAIKIPDDRNGPADLNHVPNGDSTKTRLFLLGAARVEATSPPARWGSRSIYAPKCYGRRWENCGRREPGA